MSRWNTRLSALLAASLVLCALTGVGYADAAETTPTAEPVSATASPADIPATPTAEPVSATPAPAVVPETATPAAPLDLTDTGPAASIIDIEQATAQNENFRLALWTGAHLQVTLMTIPVGGEIGLESHPELDQFLRVESGNALVKTGTTADALTDLGTVTDGSAILIPAGTWHNITNTGDAPLKLYSIYAPTQHPHGTIHATKADADAAEN